MYNIERIEHWLGEKILASIKSNDFPDFAEKEEEEARKTGNGVSK